MATKKWSTTGLKISEDTKKLKNNYNTSNQNYTNFINAGPQTSAQTTDFYTRLQKLQNNNKLSDNFKYGNQNGYNKALNSLTTREPFKYDLSNDTLYQQAKDQYQQLGKTAMADTIGQASAMTGGYGNSYATTAGSQAYQGYLQQLNNNIADYYNLALGAYDSETNRLQGNFNAFATDRGQQANEWAQNWGVYNERLNNLSNMWANSRDYDLNSYNTQASQLGNLNSQNYNAYNDSENRDFDLWKTTNDNLISLYNLRDTWEQNQITNNQNQQQIDEAERHNKSTEKLDEKSIDETGRHNKVTEKQTDTSNTIDYLYKLYSSKSGSSSSSKSGSKSSSTSATSSDVSKVLKYASQMIENNDSYRLYDYLVHLDEKYDSEIPSILNALGLSAKWLSDFRDNSEKDPFNNNKKFNNPFSNAPITF